MEEMELYFLHQTAAAILVNEDGGSDGVWLPKSQIEWEDNYPSKGELITILAPEWLLKDKGLI